VVGDGADVTVRAAGRHDHGVGDRALSLEVDVDDVLRLVVVQAFQDQLLEIGVFVSKRGDGFLLLGRVGNRIRLRVVRGRGAQLNTPEGLSTSRH